MKKLSFILLLFASIAFSATAQKSERIVPGQGVGPVRIGISSELAKEFLGDPKTVRTYEEEEDEIIKFGKNIAQELRYNTHYDLVYEYENSPEAELNYPVYKLYFKENKLVYMILTSFGYNEDVYTRVNLAGLPYNSTCAEVRKTLGYPEIWVDNPHVGELYYMNKGIDVLTQDNRMRAIFVYEPIDTNTALAIKEKVGY